MSKTFDVLVIGGGPAGVIAALTARRYYPEKSIAVIRDKPTGIIPCGIPYMFHSLANPGQNEMGYGMFEQHNIQTITGRVSAIHRKEKQVETEDFETLGYDKLVLATGSKPVVPPIAGAEIDGVFPIEKDLEYMAGVVDRVKSAENVVIVGGGFIGVELADEIAGIDGVRVHLVEILPDLLGNSFDPEFARLVENRLVEKGVRVYTNTRLERFSGNGTISGAQLSEGQTIPADYAIFGIGAKPDTTLAENSGLQLFGDSGIWVDEYMRTSDSDVFAVGDCAVKRDFFTREKVPVMLASTATAEARIAGANLFKLKVVRENKGTIAIYATYVDGLVMGSAGLTEQSARKEQFEIIVGTGQCPDKHPGKLPGTQTCQVKLIFSRNSETILGGQVAGGASCGEMINTIGTAIQKRMSRAEFETLQMATHPYLTAAPTKYPLVIAAQNANHAE